jgi:hypothetical protein
MADFVLLLVAFAAGVAVRQWYKQIWAGAKKLFGKAEADVTGKLAGTPAINPAAPATKSAVAPKS